MISISFSGSILILGCGAVSRCLQQLFLRHVELDFSKLIIVDKIDYTEAIDDIVTRGARFIQQEITPHEISVFLSQHIQPGDMLIDLATAIPTIDLIDWCQQNGVLFLNTAVEWPSKVSENERLNPENTLYAQHVRLAEAAKKWTDHGPTAVIEHGANPGLVSHWTKVALEDICVELLQRGHAQHKDMEKALADNNFAQLAFLTGTKVIHISERDTQITINPKRVNEFVNTWSVVGLYEESVLPAEFGWGTHEKSDPSLIYEHTFGHRNEAFVRKFGMDTQVYSWVPSGDIIGLLISHGEAFTISDHLTVWQDKRAMYRPSVYFVYLVSDATLASLHELKMHHYQLQSMQRIMNNDIIEGSDQMGVLLLGHELNGWWTGSTLDIHQTRTLVGQNQNPTTLQVAASILGALLWIIAHPRKGLCMPDDLPYKEILKIANPYLGTVSSIQTEWRPPLKRTMTWQIGDFLVPE